VTAKNLRPIAKALRQIARECDQFRNLVVLNFLRGCDIPVSAVCKFLDVEHTVLTVPLSLDEVGDYEAGLILKEYLGGRDFSDSHLVWIDEALSLRMGAALLRHLVRHLGKNFGHLSIWFLCAEDGTMLRPNYLKAVSEAVAEAHGRITVEYINVPVLHWMDNNRTLGMNWGRCYTFPVRRDWFADDGAYNAACRIKEDVDIYIAGAPLQFVRMYSPEFSDYIRRREKFVGFLFEKIPYRAKSASASELCIGDLRLPIPRLQECVDDPHTIWCKELPEYRTKYQWLLSDPKTLIRLDTRGRQEYETRLLALMKTA
jgi:hypothetical protein